MKINQGQEKYPMNAYPQQQGSVKKNCVAVVFQWPPPLVHLTHLVASFPIKTTVTSEFLHFPVHLHTLQQMITYQNWLCTFNLHCSSFPTSICLCLVIGIRIYRTDKTVNVISVLLSNYVSFQLSTCPTTGTLREDLKMKLRNWPDNCL